MLNIDTQHLTRDGRRHFSLMPDPRPPARTFRDLLVWQKAHRFVLALYAFTAAFPKQETYGLRSQMRRAAVSIPANIAEGFAKRSKPDKARYMNVAEGSVEESRYYLILASDPQCLQRRDSDFSPETPTLPRGFCAASSAARTERSEGRAASARH